MEKVSKNQPKFEQKAALPWFENIKSVTFVRPYLQEHAKNLTLKGGLAKMAAFDAIEEKVIAKLLPNAKIVYVAKPMLFKPEKHKVLEIFEPKRFTPFKAAESALADTEANRISIKGDQLYDVVTSFRDAVIKIENEYYITKVCVVRTKDGNSYLGNGPLYSVSKPIYEALTTNWDKLKNASKLLNVEELSNGEFTTQEAMEIAMTRAFKATKTNVKPLHYLFDSSDLRFIFREGHPVNSKFKDLEAQCLTCLEKSSGNKQVATK